jgi:hypothetical protein
VAEMVTFNGGKWGKRQKAKNKPFKLDQSKSDFFVIFFLTLLSKIISLHPSFNYENKAKIISKK